MEYILQAIGIGFLLSVMVGPVFFILLETSITKGTRAALLLDLGVFVSDIIYILFAFIFASQIKNVTDNAANNNMLLSVIGGALFLGYGIYSLLKKPALTLQGNNKRSEGANNNDFVFIMKGFMLNFVNPAVLFYWIGIIAQGNQAVDKESKSQLFIFVIIVLITYFGIDVLKILGAKVLRPFVTESLLKALNNFIGIVFIAFGLFLILKQFFLK
jgi:threonine/homoserine/homoserine lactone efflux protein